MGKRKRSQHNKQQHINALVEQAKQQQYLSITSDTPQQVYNFYRHECKQMLYPMITVKAEGACATLTFDVGPVGKGLEIQGRLKSRDPWPCLTPSLDLQARLNVLIERYMQRSPIQAQSYSPDRDTLILQNILTEDIADVIHGLLALWSEALIQYEALLVAHHQASIVETPPPPEPAWKLALQQIAEQEEVTELPPLPESVVLPERFASLLSKEQLCTFLNQPLRTRESKEALVKQVREILATDQQEKARFFAVFSCELAVEPWEVEQILTCSTTERRRWTEDGKLHSIGTRSIHKHSRELIYPIFDRRDISGITGTDIERWRNEHQKLVHKRRETGARKALESRKTNDQARKQEFAAVETRFREWEQREFPELAAVFCLAFWTMWASRFAKENQAKSISATRYQDLYLQRHHLWYARKDEALALMVKSSYATLSYYRPDEANKMTLQLCTEHYELMHEGLYAGKWDLYASHRKEIHSCPHCQITTAHDYYALYSVEFVAPEHIEMLRFSFHVPYPIGRHFLPPPQTLPQVQHIEQEDSLFRFGRRLEAGEQILYREKDVEKQFNEALDKVKKMFDTSPG